MRRNDLPPRPQLVTYPDSLGGNMQALGTLLAGTFDGLFRGVHVLPPFPSSSDRGFAPLTYRQIDPRFGSWEDMRRIGERYQVVLDLMINHLSRKSPEFLDFERRGRRSPFADLFITVDKVWPDGEPPAADVARIFLRKPQTPFSTITVGETNEKEVIWTSFGTATWSEQIDLDVTSSATQRFIVELLRLFASHRVQMVRLDAVGYVIKKPGTSCFMVEPEIYQFLEWISNEAASLGLLVLPEVHDVYTTHQRLSGHGFWTYDFVLPGLVLEALETGSAVRLAQHLTGSPHNVVTTLDSHDGIPVRPDLEGILRPSEMAALADRIERRGGNVNRLLSGGLEGGVDVHQLNCTYYSALDCDDDRYLAARAIQLFARGVPQIYYVGLLAGENDNAAVETVGDGRAINRHNYSLQEVEENLQRPVVRRLLELLRLRNAHPAFDGKVRVETDGASVLRLRWRKGEYSCDLEVDLALGRTNISSTGQLARDAGALA